MLKEIVNEVEGLIQVMEEVEAFVANDFDFNASDTLYLESIDELVKLQPRQVKDIPLLDPTPKLEIYAKRLIRTMPPAWCNVYIRTRDKRHYFGVFENENGLFAVVVPCEKAPKVNIHQLKENYLEL